jgi:hypothetical protein
MRFNNKLPRNSHISKLCYKNVEIPIQVLQGSGTVSSAQQSLVRAKETQGRVLKRISFEQPSNLEEQKAQFCTICKLLGDVAEKLSEIEFAIRSLKEALEFCPDDWHCLIVLARLYMRVSLK